MWCNARDATCNREHATGNELPLGWESWRALNDAMERSSDAGWIDGWRVPPSFVHSSMPLQPAQPTMPLDEDGDPTEPSPTHATIPSPLDPLPPLTPSGLRAELGKLRLPRLIRWAERRSFFTEISEHADGFAPICT